LADARLIDKADDLVAGIDKIITDRKLDTEKITTLQKDLTDAKKAGDDLKVEVTRSKKEAADLAKKVDLTEKQLADTSKMLDTTVSTLDMGAKLLADARVIDKADRA